MFMKIIIADPNSEVRSALELVLKLSPKSSVIGETEDVFQLLAQSVMKCPDLILFDPELVKPYRSHRRHRTQQLMDIFNVLHKICPCTKVVVMSSRLEAEKDALASEADGFISKTEPPQLFWENISEFLREEQEIW
jgi:DNA-binding NarL/FixJ family response regulator